uniref:Uncharacterized protein n=1 Tax=Lepeophtheirus salmonis TaxID=72036 RepID=A0A0K2T423_LEPSM
MYNKKVMSLTTNESSFISFFFNVSILTKSCHLAAYGSVFCFVFPRASSLVLKSLLF